MARTMNLRVDQGSTWSQNVTVYTSNTTGTFTANLYHYANGAGQIRKTYGSSSHTANISVNVHGSNTAGVLILSMNSEVTSGITAGRYVYDIEIRGGLAVTGYSSGDEAEKTLRTTEGQITITPQVTQWDW